MLPIPQLGVFKELPDCGHKHPSLVPTLYVCMMGGWLKSFLSMHRPRAAALSALNCFFVHHLAAQPESLGVIAWLLHGCCSLAFCAQGMAAARHHLIVAIDAQSLCPENA